MGFKIVLFVLISMMLCSWQWRTNTANVNLSFCEEQRVTVHSQSELDQFLENATVNSGKGITDCLHLSLAGELPAGHNNYILDIVKLMNISLTKGGILTLESKGGPVEIDCTASQSDVKELREVVQPISRAALVLMDGLVITGCPVPIMIEEASNVTIQNCVFQ